MRDMRALLPLLFWVAGTAAPAQDSPAPGELRAAVGDLGDPAFEVRERASEKLLAWGRGEPLRVFEALSEVLEREDADIEARQRSERIVDGIVWEDRGGGVTELFRRGNDRQRQSIRKSIERSARRGFAEIEPPLLDVVLEVCLEHPDPEVRIDACGMSASQEAQTESIVALLCGLLADPERRVREASAGALSRSRRPDVVSKVAQVLADPGEAPAVRRRILGGWRKDQNGQIRDALVELACGGNERLQAIALGALEGELDGKTAERIEKIALQNRGKSPSLAGQALLALGRVGGRRSAARIAAFLDPEAAPGLRQAAAQALEALFGAQWKADWGRSMPKQVDADWVLAWWNENKEDLRFPDDAEERAGTGK